MLFCFAHVSFKIVLQEFQHSLGNSTINIQETRVIFRYEFKLPMNVSFIIVFWKLWKRKTMQAKIL